MQSAIAYYLNDFSAEGLSTWKDVLVNEVILDAHAARIDEVQVGSSSHHELPSPNCNATLKDLWWEVEK